MKTIKLLSLILALIFSGITSGLSGSVIFSVGKSKNPWAAGITHRVIVHPMLSKQICNTYIIKITDETGRLVAPMQNFVPGINNYLFNETGNAKGMKRIAILELHLYPGQYYCPYDFVTPPDIKLGPFELGQIYTFELYPRAEDPNIDR